MNEKPTWLEGMFPWEQKGLHVNGQSMAYIDEGRPDARPVLLLSGNPTWGFLYRDFIGPLTRAPAIARLRRIGSAPAIRIIRASTRR